MSITELQILLDLHYGNELALLKEHAVLTKYGYLFVDSEDGQCYLFDKNGKIDDIKKLKTLDSVKKDIKKIVIPENVESIGDGAFSHCTSLKSVEIPESVKSIGDGAFNNCTSLKSIEIPESVESIENWAFWNCTSLQSIEIPESVKSIEASVFHNCSSLKEVIFKDKTIDQVKTMLWYPWGIKNEAIKCS